VRPAGIDVEDVAQDLEGRPAAVVLQWAADRFAPRVTFATAFGAEGCILVHLIGSLRLPIDIFTLDTGLLFPETLELWRRLEDRYEVTIRAVRPELTLADQAARHGDRLWESDPDRCCEIRKVLPLRRALTGFDAWVSSIRRDQTQDRSDARVVERDGRFGLVKVNPLAGWTSDDVRTFVARNDVPVNPLHERGYPSVGCRPCTTPVAAGEDPRAGRWRGRIKTECGLHARPTAGSALPVLTLNR
jgi:phosphoadenylyl-sulfate reductase (thioredoxin)